MALEKAVKVARGDGHEHWANLSNTDRDMAELGVRRIAAAGYRILAPGEPDGETLERAAEVGGAFEGKPCRSAPGWTEEERQAYDAGQIDASTSIATAIRALKGGIGE